MSEDEPFDPNGALRTLTEHGVRFVVIGGYGAELLGSPVVSFDLDICYARTGENLGRLAGALKELGARLRGPDVREELPFDERALALGGSFTFSTIVGPVDILAT